MSETKLGNKAKIQTITAAEMFKDFSRKTKALLNNCQNQSEPLAGSNDLVLPQLGRGLADDMVVLDDVPVITSQPINRVEIAKVWVLGIQCC